MADKKVKGIKKIKKRGTKKKIVASNKTKVKNGARKFTTRST